MRVTHSPIKLLQFGFGFVVKYLLMTQKVLTFSFL